MLGLSLYALHPFELAEILLVLPLLATVLVVFATSMFRYTYGEIGADGLHYRRLWGWQNAPWSEIASVDLDPKVRNAILVRLNHGNRWQSRLRFPEIWSQTDQERQEIIDLCKAHLINATHAIR